MDSMSCFGSRPLTLHEALELAGQHMQNARSATNFRKKLQLCKKVETAIKDAKKIVNKQRKGNNKTIDIGIARTYHEYSILLTDLKRLKQARKSHKQAEKWGYIHLENQKVPGTMMNPTHPSLCPFVVSSNAQQHFLDAEKGPPKKIFTQNITPPVAKYQFPDVDRRLKCTRQLVYCLSLLAAEQSGDRQLDQDERRWLEYTIDKPHERERLQAIATNLVRAFIRDKVRQSAAVKEIVCLAPVLGQKDFRKLLDAFVDGIRNPMLQDGVLLDGLAQLIRDSPLDNFDVDNLLKVLELLHDSLQVTHSQSRRRYQLAHITSRVLDCIVGSQIGSLYHDRIHPSLLDYLKGWQDNMDPYLVFQTAYAIQALAYMGDDETRVQAKLRRSGNVMKGISAIVSALKANDPVSVQKGLPGENVESHALVGAYENAVELANSGKNFYECIKEAFNFDNKSIWYPALRSLDSLIQDGRFAEFEKLIREAQCRMDPAYQWGVCQRLGEIANNPLWDINTCKSAVRFLLEMYEDDTVWGEQVNVKQWILHILTQLESSPDKGIAGYVRVVLPDLASNGNLGKQALFQS
ncbi:hypothetical protein BGX20_008852, partial [Mortierella sp. AD010]